MSYYLKRMGDGTFAVMAPVGMFNGEMVSVEVTTGFTCMESAAQHLSHLNGGPGLLPWMRKDKVSFQFTTAEGATCTVPSVDVRGFTDYGPGNHGCLRIVGCMEVLLSLESTNAIRERIALANIIDVDVGDGDLRRRIETALEHLAMDLQTIQDLEQPNPNGGGYLSGNDIIAILTAFGRNV